MLTENQIQYLYQFCAKHYVRYYDVQVELVDHLAASIENELAKDPGLGFEGALNKVYKGFGVMGFSTVVAERMAAVQKKTNKRHWKLFLSYFTVPRIAFTCLLFVLLNLPFRFLPQFNRDTVLWAYCVAAAVFGVGAIIYLVANFKNPKKQLLALNGFNAIFSVFGILLQVPNLYFNLLRAFFQNQPALVVGSQVGLVLVTVILVVACMAGLETYKRAYQEARQQYPLAFQ